MGLWDWSTVAEENDDSDIDINWIENQNPSTVNNSARQMMAKLARWRDDLTAISESSGAANIYAVTTGTTISSYIAGITVVFKAHQTNTSSCLINLDGVGNVPLKFTENLELGGGDITDGGIYWASYDGNQFLLLNPGSGTISIDQLAPSLVGRLTPVGAVLPWPADTAPAGWFLADGSAISRTTYSELFGILGVTYGAGDGSTTFNLPDWRGEFLRGTDLGSGNDPDAASRQDRGDGTTGDAAGTTQTDQVKQHDHAILDRVIEGRKTEVQQGTDTERYEDLGVGTPNNNAPWTLPGTVTELTGGTESRGRNVSVNWIIFGSPQEAANAATTITGLSGYGYTFDDDITMVDPGLGNIRRNNADPALVTQLAISHSTADAGNPDIEEVINSWDDSNSTVKGSIKLSNSINPENFDSYNFTAITNNVTWSLITAQYTGNAGNLVDGNAIAVNPTRTGDAGAGGGGGSVSGPLSSTDDAFARWNGTTGTLLKDGPVQLATADISDDAITYPKIQDVSNNNLLLGRNTAGAGNIEELAASVVRTILNIEDGAQQVNYANVRAALNLANLDTSFNLQRISNLADAVNPNDAVTLQQLNAVVAGIDIKDSCRLATAPGDGNITLSGEQTIDGVLTSADRVLVKDQTNAAENGLYDTGAGAWTRTSDADDDADVTSGLTTFITEGASQAATTWILTTDDPIIVDTTLLNFTQAGAATTILAGAGLLASGNVFDVIAADGTIQVNADSIQVGTINTPNIANDAVTGEKLRNSVGQSVMGKSDPATGSPEDIVAALDNQVLRRLGTSIGFGQVAKEGIEDNAIDNAKLADMTGDSLKGKTGTAGDPADLQATNFPIEATPAAGMHVVGFDAVNALVRFDIGAFLSDELNDLTDVTLTAPTTGHILVSDVGGLFTNQLHIGAGGAVHAVFSDTVAGFVPAPNNGGLGLYLQDNGTWATPAGAGNVTGPVSSTTGGFAKYADGTGTLLADSPSQIATGDIANEAVTNAKLADMSANTIKGKEGGPAGDPEDLSAAQVRSIINVEDGANNYSHPNHTGEVTSTGDGAQVIADNAVVTDRIANDAVTNAKLANMAANTFKARATIIGDPEDLSANAASSVLDSATDPFLRTSAALVAPVDNSELATMPAYSFKANITGGIATPTDAANGNITEEPAPAAGMFVLGFLAGGAIRKYDIGNLPSGGGGGGHTIQDEGISLTQRTNLNFVGTGVTVTDGGAGPDSTIVTIAAGAAPIDSVFGRTGTVIAAASDYDASQVDNDSGVTGLFVSNALDQLNTDKLEGPIATADISDNAVTNAKLADMGINTIKGAAVAGDPIDLSANQASSILDSATDPFLRTSAETAAPVDSVFGRTGIVAAAPSDYDASQVDNDSGVTGAFVDDALNTLNSGKAPTVHTHVIADVTDAGALAALNTVNTAQIDDEAVTNAKLAHVATNRIKGRQTALTGDVEDLTPDGASNILDAATDPFLRTSAAPQDGHIVQDEGIAQNQRLNLDFVGSGVAVTDDVGGNRTVVTISGGAAPVDSVFGRTGIVAAAPSDYDASQVDNDSGVTGAFVHDALNTLDSGKAPTVHTHTLAQITDSGALAALNTVGTGEIDNDAVTYAKIQNVVAADRILGNVGIAGSIVAELTAAQVRTMINVEDGANNYSHPNHTGEVTSAGDGAQTIAAGVVTNAKLADMAGNTLKGRSGTTGTPGDLTADQASTLLDGAADPFLRTSAAPAGDVTGPASATDNSIARFNGTSGKVIQNGNTVTLGDNAEMVFNGSVSYIELPEISQPATPGANRGRFYAGDVGGASRPFWLDDAGVATDISDNGTNETNNWSAGQTKEVTNKTNWNTAWNLANSNDFNVSTAGQTSGTLPLPTATNLPNNSAQAGELTVNAGAAANLLFNASWEFPGGTAPDFSGASGDYTLYYRVWRDNAGALHYRIVGLDVWG